jgi:hypothetical protein
MNYGLYPRQQADSHHINEMRQAVAAGVKLPPIIIDKKTKCVIDGFHRLLLWISLKYTKVSVVEKTYRNEAEMFLDAMRYNADHGRALSTYDRAHSVIVAAGLGLADDAIAGALLVTVERVCELRANKSATTGGGALTRAVAIKRTIGHMAGRRLNKRQIEVNKKLGGMNQLFYVRQLLMLYNSNLIDTSNADLLSALQELKAVI